MADWIQSLKSFAVDKTIVNLVTGIVHGIVFFSFRYILLRHVVAVLDYLLSKYECNLV